MEVLTFFTNELFILIVAIFIVLMTRNTTNIKFFVFGKFAITHNGFITQVIVNILNTVRRISFQSFNLCRLMLGFFNNLCNQADMITGIILIPVKENQITGFRYVNISLVIELKICQFLNPGNNTSIERHGVYLRIFQAERYKHSTPITVRDAIPITISCISMKCSIRPHFIITGTLFVSQLRLRNCKNIGVPIAG